MPRGARPRGQIGRTKANPRATKTIPEAAKPSVLSKVAASEAHAILRKLLERHPELCAEADALAAGLVTDVNPDDVADSVRDAMLSLDLDDLGGRAGRHSWGYTEPTEAAWELLQEAMDPFLNDLKRHIELGFEVSAVATCKGIVLGLYGTRGNAFEVCPRGFSRPFGSWRMEKLTHWFTAATGGSPG